MKNRDTKLFIAIILLISLVVALLVISLNRDADIKKLQMQLQELKNRPVPQPEKGEDGHSPVLGKDYIVTNGKDAPIYPPAKDGKDSVSTYTIEQVPIDNYQLALKDGFQGTLHDWLESLKVKGDKGDPADDIDLSCINGVVGKKRTTDFFYQFTNIKCEATDE